LLFFLFFVVFFQSKESSKRSKRRPGSASSCMYISLVTRPSITANAVEGLVKLLCRMMSGGHTMDVWRRGTYGKWQC